MPEHLHPLTVRPSRGSAEFSELVEVWRSAVRATHDFLEQADFDRIERDLATTYLPAVTLLVAERDGRLLGFAGVADQNLEMLFVSDSARGQGIGSILLAEVVERFGVTRVDVNEQNAGAHAFYLSRGFVPIGRSALDGDGRPYPLVHLGLPG